jgi:putative ABC transport system permease protein
MHWPWGRRTRDQELDEEIGAHLQMAIQDRMAFGGSEREARIAANREFGNIGLVQEVTREMWRWAQLKRWGQDVCYALRQMRKSPGFGAVVVLVLALAIGANSSVFSVLNAVLLRPPDFPNANRIVQITSVQDGKPVGVSPSDWHDYAAQNHTFEKIAIYDQWRKNVSTSPRGDDASEVLVGLAPAEFFETLGIQPLLGRLFTPQEGLDRNHVALITETFWQSHYQRDPRILGRTLIVNDQPDTIIGVLPATIPGWLHRAQAQLPVFEPFLPGPGVGSEQSRSGRGYGAIGLLGPGVTVQKAQADLARIAGNLAMTYPVDQGLTVAVRPLTTMRTGDLRQLLLLLMGLLA